MASAPKPSPEPTAVAQRVVRGAYRKGQFSVSTMMEKSTANGQNGEQKLEKRATPFTIDDLTKVWFLFPSKHQEMHQFKYIFQKAPVLDGSTINIEVSSKMVETQIREIFPKLREYLWKALDNETIRLNTTIKEAPKGLALVTSKDKIRFLAEKNSQVKDLYRDLHLELE